MPKRDYPGSLTRSEWRALPKEQRHRLVRQAQCDLLGSFRYCRNKLCKRRRSCSSKNPAECFERLWRLKKTKPKILRSARARLEEFLSV